jgi:hypothetical protein
LVALGEGSDAVALTSVAGPVRPASLAGGFPRLIWLLSWLPAHCAAGLGSGCRVGTGTAVQQSGKQLLPRGDQTTECHPGAADGTRRLPSGLDITGGQATCLHQPSSEEKCTNRRTKQTGGATHLTHSSP